jgi:hypothetical protein
MRQAGRLVLFAAFVFLCGPVAAMVFDDLVPAAGPIGASVHLVARAPLTGSHTVRLGESGEPIAATPQGNELHFTIPSSASTGDLFVSHDGGDFEPTGFVFRVARTVQVRVQVPDATLFASHDVGSNIEDAVANANGWVLPVSLGETALVAATSGDPGAPQLLALVTDSMDEVVLSGLSTATAMIFLAPGVFTADPIEADARLTAIAGLDGVVAAAAIAEGHLASGRDFLSDARYEDALAEALIAYSTLLADEIDGQLDGAAKFAEDTVTDNHGFATGSPHDIVGAVNVLRIQAMGPTANADNIPVNRFGYEGRPLGVLGKKINPLDWIAHAWALDPEQFTGGIPAIHALTAAEVETRHYDRLAATPVSSLSVKATNVLKNLNLIDVASDLLLGIAPSFPPADGLEFPSDRHGVYMVRAYSGAVYPHLDPLIGLLPEAGDEDAFMKGINVVLAAVEFASILLPVKSVLGSEVLAKLVYRAAREAMAATVREGKESGRITAEFLGTVFLEVARGIVKQLMSVAAEQGLKAIPQLGKSVAKFFNVLGKAAAVGASVERLAALTNASRLISDRAFFAPSVESTVVVVGDPFAPEVLEISPLRAHRGRVVRLTGRRFLAHQPGAHIVQFGALGTDPHATTGAGEVLFASEDTLLVRVPEEASSGPITVAIVDRGVANSVRIADGQGIFEVIPDPVLTAVEPASVLPGGTIRIVGANFSPKRGENRVTFSGSGLGANLLVLDHWEEGLLIQAPPDLVSGTVTVTVGTRSSNALPLTTVLSGTIPGGATLTVSSTADNTAADGHLTLREAILLATGQLGRALTSPPEERPPGATYETDFVSGTPGAGVRDTIDASFNGTEPTIALVAPLPALGNFDVVHFSQLLELGTVIDGSATGGDGLALSGIRTRVVGGALRNFAGNGIRFADGALGNEVWRTRVVSPGLHGVLFEGDVTFNVLDAIEVQDAPLDGILLSGPGVRFNRMTRPGVTGPQVRIGHVENSGGWGLRITGGATYNWLAFGDMLSNASGGVYVEADSPGNLLGRADSSIGIFPRVFSNDGPGILIEAGRTAVRYVNVGSNNGDGILFQGPLARDGHMDIVRVGYDHATGAAAPNAGHGIHIRSGAGRILIGRRELSSFGARNSIAGNRDDGIRVDGSTGGGDFVEIKHTHVGLAMSGSNTEVPLANGANGIALIQARDCQIGDFEIGLDVHVNNHTTGAGILVSGLAATRNVIVNCQIGSHHDGRDGIGNGIGIRLAGGAWGNRIGQRNAPLLFAGGDQFIEGQGANVIMNNSVAGILIESGGDPTVTQAPTDPPTGGNIVVGNRFGGPADFAPVYRPNEVGLRLTAGARHNRIGGPEKGDGNLFVRNRAAGIHIEGGSVTARSANRILGNVFERQGATEPLGTNPHLQRPPGVGVLVSDGASGHWIGSRDALAGNRFHGNQVGVYVEDSQGIVVAGNQFLPGAGAQGNTLAAIVLRDSTHCVCGPHNVLRGNGNSDDALGAILLAGGGLHRIWGNEIGGEFPDDPPASGNNGHGITLYDSADNTIGGPPGAGNVMVNNTGYALAIRGPLASGNRVVGNQIGVCGVASLAPRPNLGGGVLIADGAHSNKIGALVERVRGGQPFLVPVGNRIIGNAGDGVRVDGATTVGNTIEWNEISDHDEMQGRLGIRLSAGGNHNLPAPEITHFEGGLIRGTVAPAVPNGSRVQVFADPDDEGLVLLGEAIVASGEWSALSGLLPYPALTATVTHAVSGSTSPFGTRVTIDDVAEAGLRVRRAVPGVPVDSTIAFNQSAVIHDLELLTAEFPVLVRELVVRLGEESATPQFDGDLALYHDTNHDGKMGPGDRLLSAAGAQDTTEPLWRFADLDVRLAAESHARWLLVGRVTALDEPTGHLQLLVQAAADIPAVLLFPAAPLTPVGPFPVPSDRFAVRQGAPSSVWVLY